MVHRRGRGHRRRGRRDSWLGQVPHDHHRGPGSVRPRQRRLHHRRAHRPRGHPQPLPPLDPGLPHDPRQRRRRRRHPRRGRLRQAVPRGVALVLLPQRLRLRRHLPPRPRLLPPAPDGPPPAVPAAAAAADHRREHDGHGGQGEGEGWEWAHPAPVPDRLRRHRPLHGLARLAHGRPHLGRHDLRLVLGPRRRVPRRRLRRARGVWRLRGVWDLAGALGSQAVRVAQLPHPARRVHHRRHAAAGRQRAPLAAGRHRLHAGRVPGRRRPDAVPRHVGVWVSARGLADGQDEAV